MTVYKLQRVPPPPYALRSAFSREHFLLAYNELAKTGRWGEGGWWQPFPSHKIKSVVQHIERAGFEVVYRYGSPFRENGKAKIHS